MTARTAALAAFAALLLTAVRARRGRGACATLRLEHRC